MGKAEMAGSQMWLCCLVAIVLAHASADGASPQLGEVATLGDREMPMRALRAHDDKLKASIAALESGLPLNAEMKAESKTIDGKTEKLIRAIKAGKSRGKSRGKNCVGAVKSALNKVTPVMDMQMRSIKKLSERLHKTKSKKHTT